MNFIFDLLYFLKIWSINLLSLFLKAQCISWKNPKAAKQSLCDFKNFVFQNYLCWSLLKLSYRFCTLLSDFMLSLLLKTGKNNSNPMLLFLRYLQSYFLCKTTFYTNREELQASFRINHENEWWLQFSSDHVKKRRRLKL